MWTSDNWREYTLLDASDGERLERWGDYTLIRPDPQVIWKGAKSSPEWQRADASYRRSESGGGNWSENRLPEQWTIKYGDLSFKIKPMGFKHTGIFPEQASNWDWFSKLISNCGRKVNVLNLFAYTGGATIAAAKAGAAVCHVDAARGIVEHAKENARLSGLSEAPIRYIVDDCRKFVEREIRRNNKYDAVIIDPPSYGRGPTGEVWKLAECIDELVALTAELMSDKPLFYLLNSYTTGLSASAMKYIADIRITDKFRGKSEADELGLTVKSTNHPLPCGSSVRCVFE